MSYTKTQESTLNQNRTYYSNGTELVPAEVQVNIRQDQAQSSNTPFVIGYFVIGYTMDDEGLINGVA
ncbi:MAG: hypothetical protein IGS48_17360 [Oscillatoriales cyanobacterium C42_A2020_001]|nr:hypothetical protein [Leptolyngbyaceae cyanobacterium C42_A2020_001]